MVDVDYEVLPEHMQAGARRYIEQGIISEGSFLFKVLSNDLLGAFMKADDVNTERMVVWAKWIYTEAPGGSHGSVEKVKSWAAKGGLGVEADHALRV